MIILVIKWRYKTFENTFQNILIPFKEINIFGSFSWRIFYSLKNY